MSNENLDVFTSNSQSITTKIIQSESKLESLLENQCEVLNKFSFVNNISLCSSVINDKRQKSFDNLYLIYNSNNNNKSNNTNDKKHRNNVMPSMEQSSTISSSFPDKIKIFSKEAVLKNIKIKTKSDNEINYIFEKLNESDNVSNSISIIDNNSTIIATTGNNYHHNKRNNDDNDSKIQNDNEFMVSTKKILYNIIFIKKKSTKGYCVQLYTGCLC